MSNTPMTYFMHCFIWPIVQHEVIASIYYPVKLIINVDRKILSRNSSIEFVQMCQNSNVLIDVVNAFEPRRPLWVSQVKEARPTCKS